VLYTHEHADHTHGIDDLRVLAIYKRRLVDIHADDRTAALLRTASAIASRPRRDRCTRRS